MNRNTFLLLVAPLLAALILLGGILAVRKPVTNAVSIYRDYVSSIREMAGSVADEERAVVGGTLQTMQAVNKTILNASSILKKIK